MGCVTDIFENNCGISVANFICHSLSLGMKMKLPSCRGYSLECPAGNPQFEKLISFVKSYSHPKFRLNSYWFDQNFF